MIKKVSLFLDSGAFSAWSKKIDIDIDSYISFCLKYEKYFDIIANLDVIPGEFGTIPDKIEVDKSAKKGFDNYYYMLNKGVPKNKLMHIFHQGEDWKWLIKMTKEMEYIGLSPANDRTTLQKRDWLDECMEYVTDSVGMPIVKFHGFGLTSVPLMIRYPWYSVDSTSWVTIGRFGGVYVPKKIAGKYSYNKIPFKINVSDKSPSQKEVGRHYTTLSKVEQKEIKEYFDIKGFTVEELATMYQKRDELNIIYFLDLEKNLPEWPWPFKIKTSSGGLGL